MDWYVSGMRGISTAVYPLLRRRAALKACIRMFTFSDDGSYGIAASRFSLLPLLFMALMAGYLSFQVAWPFLSSFVWAVFLAVVFYPVYRWAARYTRSKRIGSAITTVLVVFVILGPFTVLVYLVLKEISLLLTYLQDSKFEPGASLTTALRIDGETISPSGRQGGRNSRTVRDSITALGKGAAGHISKTAAGLFGAVFSFIFTIISTFHPLCSRQRNVGQVSGLSALLDEEVTETER